MNVLYSIKQTFNVILYCKICTLLKQQVLMDTNSVMIYLRENYETNNCNAD